MAAVAYIAPHIFLTLYAVHGRLAGCHKRRFPLFVHRCASGSGQMDSARDWYWEGNVFLLFVDIWRRMVGRQSEWLTREQKNVESILKH
jgi:hypothetical protein